MLGATTLSISSVSLLETRIVLYSRHGEEAVQAFDEMLGAAGVDIAPFTEELSQTAYETFRRFGKGQGHPAQLNIVDCAVYALAIARNEPLLFKGDDFARTDVISAL
jgi:ribonuclease VapC